MSYRETYRVEIPGRPGHVYAGFTTKQAAIEWAQLNKLPRYMVWSLGAAMYVHQEFGQ